MVLALRAVLVMLIFLLGLNTAVAQDKKFSNVASWCVLSTDADYANVLCKRLKDETRKLSATSKLGYMDLGSHEDKPGQPWRPEKATSETVDLVFFIRGTKGGTVSSSVQISAGIYKPAGEAGIDRGGQMRIVLWEQGAVADGPPDQISEAMGNHMTTKLVNLFEWLGGD